MTDQRNSVVRTRRMARNCFGLDQLERIPRHDRSQCRLRHPARARREQQQGYESAGRGDQLGGLGPGACQAVDCRLRRTAAGRHGPQQSPGGIGDAEGE